MFLLFCYFVLGTILLRVSMEWTSMLFLNARDTVLHVAVGARLALGSSIELPRMMP